MSRMIIKTLVDLAAVADTTDPDDSGSSGFLGTGGPFLTLALFDLSAHSFPQA